MPRNFPWRNPNPRGSHLSQRTKDKVSESVRDYHFRRRAAAVHDWPCLAPVREGLDSAAFLLRRHGQDSLSKVLRLLVPNTVRDFYAQGERTARIAYERACSAASARPASHTQIRATLKAREFYDQRLRDKAARAAADFADAFDAACALADDEGPIRAAREALPQVFYDAYHAGRSYHDILRAQSSPAKLAAEEKRTALAALLTPEEQLVAFKARRLQLANLCPEAAAILAAQRAADDASRMSRASARIVHTGLYRGQAVTWLLIDPETDVGPEGALCRHLYLPTEGRKSGQERRCPDGPCCVTWRFNGEQAQ
jgi:hypothetical protein